MGLDDKIENKAQEATGEAKQTIGEATDDKELQAEGKADQRSANLKQAGQKIKDAFRRK
ncbi:CsbD family protein [Actinoplanes lobatus]|nr:CsbD family protein [Actinoplanes lobatus]GIE45409.1 CsbD family protein [Actinoplanes lobatus]